MDIQQDILAYILKWKKKSKGRAIEERKSASFAVELDEIKDSLSIFASAIFARTIEIRHTDTFPYISSTKLFLPSFIAFAGSKMINREAYQLMVLNLWAISTLVPARAAGLDDYEDFKLINAHIPQAYQLLKEKIPNYESAYAHLISGRNELDQRLTTPDKKEFKQSELPGFDLRSMWGRVPQLTQTFEAGNAPAEDKTAFPEATTERQNKAKGQIKKIDLDEDKENLGQDVFAHFEKVETAEEYKGIQRDMDGADEMEQHADAIDDLSIEQVIRTNKTARSLYKTELDMGFEVADFKGDDPGKNWEEVFYYDEWDHKKRNYKKDWCRVIYSSYQASGISRRSKSLKLVLSERKNEIGQLRKKLVQLASEVRVFKKLFYGRSIDIDNVIRNACRRRSGDSGDQRYYQETRKKNRDMACLLLVDNSLSSDAWVQNRRVLDVELEALLTFGEASSSLGDPIMVAGFNSNTRHDCKFIQWKDFDEPWGKFLNEVDEIMPSGYTRIGPAIRHATHILSKRREKHKLLLIFTDGRPTDFDRYEGSHGLGDVRQAVREADREGVVSFALAIDPSAKQFLPQLFGQGNFQILNDVKLMPQALAKLYARMSKRC